MKLLEEIPPYPSASSVVATSASSASWGTVAASKTNIDNFTILSEDATSGVHIISLSPFTLVTGVRYSYSVWVKAINRSYCYLTIAPGAATSRSVAVFGLNGEGFLESRVAGGNVTNPLYRYRKCANGIYQCTIEATTTGGAPNFLILGIVDKFPATFNASSDVTFQGLNQPSISVHGIELIRI